ncbi:MAG: hypothetical protein KDA85_15230 [Planctomycetaceae bacterium]|nr:hypothetical protein [Planctomycetaceae bacterium]
MKFHSGSVGLPILLAVFLLPHWSEPALAQSSWVTRVSRNGIDLYAEFALQPAEIWQHTDDVRREVESLLTVKDSTLHVEMVLFSSHRNYLNYLAPRIPDAQNRRAIFFRNDDVLQVYAFRSRSMITDIRHELTHAVLHHHLAFLPLWIDEGLAEYFEEPAAGRNQGTRMAAVRWMARTGWSPSLQNLEAISAATQMDGDDYRDSWAWIHFVMHDADAQKLLVDYLQTIRNGEAPGNFSRILQNRDPDAKNRLNSYFRRLQVALPFSNQ